MIMQFCIKTKIVPFRSRNRLPRNTLVSMCFKNSKFQNWPNLRIVENACHENGPTLGVILGLGGESIKTCLRQHIAI